MSVEEASSTQNVVPMETAETPGAALTNGTTSPTTTDLESRVKQLLDGVYGDDIEEVLNFVRLVADSCSTLPIPPHVAEAVHFMTDFVVTKSCAIKGISIVSELLSRVHQSGVLTSLHSDLLQLCLYSKLLSPALTYINSDIHTISPDEDVKYVLQYFYYGGCIYAALKRFSRALHFLELCLSVPNQQTTSAIQVVAYQKYSLISVLCNEETRPRLGHLHVSIPYLCRPYSNLVQIAHEGDADRFAATIAQMTPFLEKHNNMGLAKQALEKIKERDILKFQSMFISLKLSALASHLRLPVQEVENRLLNMIRSGQLSAQICKKDNVVWFNKQNDIFDEGAAIERLQSSLETCISSYKKAKELHSTLSVDPKLLARIAETESRKEGAPTSSSWDFPVHGKSKKILSFMDQ